VLRGIGRAVGWYRGEGWRTQLHVAVRALTCPVDEIVAAVPDGSRVVEVGCGHGLLAVSIAVARPGVHVRAVDVDSRKLGAARRAARRAGVEERVQVEEVGPRWQPPEHTAEVVLVGDVLYLLDDRELRRWLRGVHRALVPEGRLVVKELDAAPGRRTQLATAQERWAVERLGITVGATVRFRAAHRWRELLESAGFEVHGMSQPRAGWHRHVLFVARRPAVEGLHAGSWSA